jgi:hypothetical protein
MNLQDMFDTEDAKKFIKFTDEHRAQISAVHKGKTISDEHRAQISAANLGRKHSPEILDKIKNNPRRGGLGKTISDEHRAQISAVHKGKTVSEDTRAKISAASPKIKSKPTQTPLGLFPSKKAAAEAHGFSPQYMDVKFKKFPTEYYYVTKGEAA